jgi:hypothetical protein
LDASEVAQNAIVLAEKLITRGGLPSRARVAAQITMKSRSLSADLAFQRSRQAPLVGATLNLR